MAKEDNKEEELISFIDDESDSVVDVTEKQDKQTDNTNDRLAAAEAETARLRAQIEADRSAAYGANRHPNNVPDVFDQELNAINERQKALGIQWEVDKASGRLKSSPALVEDYEKKAREIEDQKSQLSTKRALRDMLPAITQEQQRMQLRAQYSDVYNNPAAITYAEGAYKMFLASGEQDGPQLLDKAMNHARVQFKMPGASYMKPTDSDKARLSGVPGGGGRSPQKDIPRMTKAEKQMAEAMYIDTTNGDQKRAWAMWATKVGKKALKEIRKNGLA